MTIFRARAFKALSELKSNLLFSQISMNQNRRCSSIPLQSQLERVGFIGLGNMGFHMANNLVDAGFKGVVHDINSNAMRKFLDKGVPTKETPLEVAESSDVIITMLPSSSHFRIYKCLIGLLNYILDHHPSHWQTKGKGSGVDKSNISQWPLSHPWDLHLSRATFKVSTESDDGGEGCTIEWSFVADPMQRWSLEGLVTYIEESLKAMAEAALQTTV